MKYTEQAGLENFKRFERLTKQVLSVSNAAVKEKIAEEKRQRERKKKTKR